MTRAAAVGLALLASRAPAREIAVRPAPSASLFANPGMGWQTFNSFADDPENAGGPPSASAYFRMSWAELEPRRGEIRFGYLDHLVARARHAGQKLSLRVMCAGTDPSASVYCPGWLLDAGCHGRWYTHEGEHGRFWAPDFADPAFQEAHLKFIAALGDRYDGQDVLDLVDVGTVGLWGEWHFSGTDVPMPPEPVARSIVAAWVSAFPKTPKAVQLHCEPGMRMAGELGLGWRADCLGDWGGFSPTWSHMKDFYRPELARLGGGELWRKAPVAFEACWDIREWVAKGWDVAKTFDFALDLHASYFNDKSAPVPAAARPAVDRFLARAGYRLALRRLVLPDVVTRGERFPATLVWENLGVAPPYRDDREAIRFTLSPTGERTLLPGAQIRGWLPGGEIESTLQPMIPAAYPAGSYTVWVAVVSSRTGEPDVRLAVAEAPVDGWYPVGRIEAR